MNANGPEIGEVDNSENSIDGMAAINFTDEEDCGFFGTVPYRIGLKHRRFGRLIESELKGLRRISPSCAIFHVPSLKSIAAGLMCHLSPPTISMVVA